MKTSTAADEFAVRYYRWSLDEATAHAFRGFSDLQLVQSVMARDAEAYLCQVSATKLTALTRALVKRFHPKALALLGDRVASDEQQLLDEKDEAMKAIFTPRRTAGVRGTRPSHLRKAIRIGSSALGDPLEIAKAQERFEFGIGPWRIRTVVAYSRNASYNQFVVSPDGHYLRDGISFLSHLGLSGQTVWDLAVEGEEPQTAASILQLAGHFVNAANSLLTGID